MKNSYALLPGIALVAASAAAARLMANRALFLQICSWVVVGTMLGAGMLAEIFGNSYRQQSGLAAEKDRRTRYEDAKKLLLAGVPSLLAVLYLRFIS
ncbi:MAG TPA: DUF5316 domain-containing protein [Firmicutes bacterium]|nr:DUF5316 domain-containing protein [Bacillota bacterium]